MTYSDADLNEDWIKTLSWDMPADWPTFYTTIVGASNPLSTQKEVIRYYQSLAAWEAVPDTIRQGAEALLAQTG